MYWASTSCAQRIYYPHTSLLQTRYISWLGYQLRRAYGYGFPRRVLLLDFSHLRAKELEIGSSAQCATSANQGAYTILLPLTTVMHFMIPSPHFSLNASSNTSSILIRVTFCGSSRETDTQKVPGAFVESLSDAVC